MPFLLCKSFDSEKNFLSSFLTSSTSSSSHIKVSAKQFLSGTLNSAHLIRKIFFSVDFLWTDGKGRFLFILLWTLSLSISGYNNFFIIPFSLSLFLLFLVVKKVSLKGQLLDERGSLILLLMTNLWSSSLFIGLWLFSKNFY